MIKIIQQVIVSEGISIGFFELGDTERANHALMKYVYKGTIENRNVGY